MLGALVERIHVNKPGLAGPASLPITCLGARTAPTIRRGTGLPSGDKMTKLDADEVLNLEVRCKTRLLIDYRTSLDRDVSITDVIKIAGEHITNTELAPGVGITSQAVRLKAAAFGLTRLSEAGYERQLVKRLLLRNGVDA